MHKNGYLYILTNKPNGVLYIGVTSHLIKRVYEHKTHAVSGFSSRYHLTKLVYYEVYDDISEAILREKRMKKWKRDWKIELIEQHNPHWNDVYESLC